MATRWYHAPCPRGLEQVLGDEVRAADPAEVRERPGGVSFRSGVETAYRVVLWSRVASRVLEELERGRLKHADDVYTVAQRVRWEKLIAPGQTFSVRVSGRSPLVSNSHYAALKVKDAIVDQLRDLRGERPDVDLDDPDVPLRIHLDGKVLTISRDLAGAPLNRRGYRGALHASPLNEALAAGLLLLAGYQGQDLCDPMCGSGTFLIEAGFIAGDRAPGLRRPMQLTRFLDHDASCWKALLDEAEARWQAGRSKIPLLHGGDLHPGSIALARGDAERAEVPVILERTAAADLRTEARFVVCNPPYGERLDVQDAWGELGRFLKAHPGVEAWLLSGDASLTRALRLRTSARIPVKNGSIDCRWLRYEIND